MSESLGFLPFANSKDKRTAASGFARVLNSVFFFYFAGENWGPDMEDADALDEFSDLMWAATCASMGAMNISVLGRTEDGKTVITIEPYEQIKEFLMTKDIGLEGDTYYEDVFDEIGEDSGFGKHDETIV